MPGSTPDLGIANACHAYPHRQDSVVTRCRFTLDVSPEKCLQYYRGDARRIAVTSDKGLRLAFPAAELRPFMTANGVQGRFEIVFDANHKLKSLTRV